MHYIVVSLIILQMTKIPTANTLTKNANPECYPILPDADIELISLHQIASHFNSKWQLRPMIAIVYSKMAKIMAKNA